MKNSSMKKILCLVIAFMMMMPVMPSSLAGAEETLVNEMVEPNNSPDVIVNEVVNDVTTEAAFTVEYYLSDSNGDYSLEEVISANGTVGSIVKDDDYAKEIEGFKYVSGAFDEVSEAEVTEDGAAVLKLYYTLEPVVELAPIITPYALFEGGVYNTEGGVMDAMGQSTNSHLVGYLAWFDEGTGDMYIAFNASDTAVDLKTLVGAIYYDENLSETAIVNPELENSYEEIRGPITIDGITYGPNSPNTGEPYEFPNWLVINFGSEITFSDPFYIGLDYSENGFDALEDSKIKIDIANYTVQYKPNGGTGDMSDINNPYNDGETVTVMDTGFSRSGYYFNGWNTKADGTGDQYYPGNTFTMPEADVELYAQWSLKRSITVTADSNTKVYDGTPLTDDRYSYTGMIASGDSLVVTVDGTITNVGTADNIITSAKVMSGTTDVSSNYDITKVNGALIVTPASVIITVNDASKEFGTSDPAFTGTVSGLIGSDSIGTVSYSRTGSDENVGTYANVLTASYTSNSNYTVTVYNGDFTITKATEADLNITNYSDVYDAEFHSIVVTNTIAGDTVYYKVGDGEWSTTNPSYTNVGTYTVSVKVTNPNYADRTGSGTVEIKPAPVTITVNDASKVFGTTDPVFTGTVEGLIGSDSIGTVSYSRTGSDENVGAYEDVLNASYTPNSNYTVTVDNGDFTITTATGAALNITNYSDVYDAESHSILVTNTIAGDTVYYSTNGGETWSATNPSYTNVGEYTVNVKVTNPNYEDRFGVGTVEITPASVTITVNDASKVFGTTDPAFTGTVSGLIGSDNIGTVSYSRTEIDENVGAYEDVLTALYTPNSNYIVTVDNGDFTITTATGAALNITNYSDVYDAESHNILVTNTIAGDTVYYSTNGGETWSATNPSYTNVGEYTVNVKVTNPNYEDRFGVGTVEITPASVTIVVNDASKVFGTTDPVFTGTVSGLIGSDSIGTVSYSRTGSDENVGTYPNVLTASYKPNSNYTVTVNNGDFTITAATGADLNITNYSDVYDAESHSILVTNTIDGDTVLYSTDGGENWASENPAYTNVGTYTVNVKVTNTNYADRLGSGTVTINARAIEITAESASKTYDGSSLTNTNYSITSGSLVSGETISSVKVTGTQTQVGSSSNIVSDALINNGEINTTSNYSITYKPGTLTITRRSGGGDGTTIKDPEIPLADLEKFDHFAYVIGYPEGDVRPLNNITREEVAMIFYRLLTDESRNSLLSDANPFTDMENHGWSNRAISTLYNAGIIKGYPDGTFGPSKPITRAEFATIASKFDKLELNGTTKFTDIFGHWAEKYITSSEIKGWIKGYPDLTFKPEQDIRRAEAMTLINNVLGRIVPEENIHPAAMAWSDNPSTEWYYEAVMEATNSHDYIYEEDKDELWTGLKANKIWP